MYCFLIAYCLPIECLLVALDAHMFSHHGYEPGRVQGPRPKELWAGTWWPSSLGLGPWSRAYINYG